MMPENRPLTTKEADLVRWLLQHGAEEAGDYLTGVSDLRVVSDCRCGCPSINFEEKQDSEMKVLSDHRWQDEAGRLFGVFVFARGAELAGLEVWSVDGRMTPNELPLLSQLEPFGNHAA